MTGPAAAPIPITDDIIRSIGEGYLFNVVRPDGLTCDVCSTCVTPGYSTCRPCEGHRSLAVSQGVKLADQVAAVVYGAWPEHQSGRLMLTYKGDRATDQQRARVKMLGLLAFQQHRRCLEGPAVDHELISAWSSVPSTSGRQGVHPMRALGQSLGAMGAGHEVELVPGPGAPTAGQRELVPNRWVVADPATVAGRHVLLVDDTWTSGAKPQSAAAALHSAGANAVTTLVLARWMDLKFGNTRPFLNANAKAPYSPYICPVTGGACPPWSAS